ncbi:MAG: sulfite exporter TauE/SafE family protein [Candidatus Hydrogenedentes bacterium]|nr:sulfite exporter TauE/SafE family protein [Candidatus Hydrogenedentota bacterium]
MLFTIEMLVLGVCVGIISGALGLGGGVFMVPAFLFFAPGIDAHTAKGSSLLVIFFVATINAWRLNRHAERVPWALAARLAAGAIAGGYGGAWLTTKLPETAVLAVFCALLLGMAWRLVAGATAPEPKPGKRPRWLSSPLVGACGGLAGGATGTGGGLILVPLTLQAGLTTNKNVTAVSNLVMAAIAASGSIAHLRATATAAGAWVIGHVDLSLVPWVLVGALAGGVAGRRINQRLPIARRRRVLAAVLLLIVAGLLLREWAPWR